MVTVTLFISFGKLSEDSKRTFPTDSQLLPGKFKNLKFDPFLNTGMFYASNFADGTDSPRYALFCINAIQVAQN